MNELLPCTFIQVTNFIHQFNARPMSKKGYVLAARLAPRFNDYIDVSQQVFRKINPALFYTFKVTRVPT